MVTVDLTVSCRLNCLHQGHLKTWVNAKKAATIESEFVTAKGRYSIDPETFFLFGSQNNSMVGGVSIRTVRVEAHFSTDEEVTANRARDKILSMYNEARRKEVKEQRKGLSLATLFAKPRPAWQTPALIATIGDSFIEKTGFEGNSCLAWCYTVWSRLSHCLLSLFTHCLSLVLVVMI